MDLIGSIIFYIVLATLIASVIFSFRFRRQDDPNKRGLFSAKMNICLGIMLIGIAILQTFTFSEDLIYFNTGMIRTIIATLFFLLGLYNLYAGTRNHAHFKRKLQ